MLSGLEIGLEAWLAAAAVAGLAGMDDTSWPQVMISRPLVSGCAGGWLLGDAAAGLAAGAVLEMLVLRHVPYGGARCPDPGPAGVVAGAAAAGAGPGGLAVTAAAAAGGWAVGWMGEATVRLQRRLAARLVDAAEPLSRAPAALARRHRALVVADFLRGAAVGAVFLVPAVAAVRLAADPAAGRAGVLAATALAAAVGLAGGAGAAGFAARGRTGWLVAAGALAGGVGMAVLG